MKKLHILILRSFIGPFILTFFVVLFVLLMQFLWRYIDELVGKGLEFSIIGEFLLYTSASLVPMALPLSILMSSLMTFGNLGEKYELTAIKASGISLQRVMLPIIVVVFALSFGAFYFANNVLPFANLQLRTLLYDIRQKRPELSIKPGEFYNGIEGYRIRINEKDPVNNTLYNIKIYDHTESKGNNSVIIADSGTMVVTADNANLIFTLYQGYGYDEMQDETVSLKNKKYPHRYHSFEEHKMIIKLTGFNLERTDQSLFKSNYSMLNNTQLTFTIDSIENELNTRYKQLYENLIRTSYFKKRRDVKNLIKSQNTDSVSDKLFGRDAISATSDSLMALSQKQSGPNISHINLDSLYSQFTINELASIYNLAQSNARTSKNYVDNQASALDIRIKTLRRFEIEWHRKYTVAFACILFLFIGAPLGAIIRKGGLGLPLILSTLFFIFYYMISLSGEKFVRESMVADYQGMWFTSALFFVAGVFLTYKATTDSSILNFDTYSNAFKKVFGQEYNIVDVLTRPEEPKPKSIAKTENIIPSLDSLSNSIENQLIQVQELFKLGNFLVSIFAMQGISNLVLFERFFKNTIRSIIYNPLYVNRSVRATLLRFPDFRCQTYFDTNFKLFIKIILACIPIVNIIVIVRHYILLVMLKTKLQSIANLTKDLKNAVSLAQLD